ncbi:hypothetical protein AWC22_21235 [Mycobacterium riyadhense]|uniref:Uncharacterized protein n=1 Tax=Mycobacterium riyadhense TaxID=486698 RepID=A0A1X2CLI3_9MYCO|nr:hypothetical protein AWC22_21235 [Mycobacterium riyadhense]
MLRCRWRRLFMLKMCRSKRTQRTSENIESGVRRTRRSNDGDVRRWARITPSTTFINECARRAELREVAIYEMSYLCRQSFLTQVAEHVTAYRVFHQDMDAPTNQLFGYCCCRRRWKRDNRGVSVSRNF